MEYTSIVLQSGFRETKPISRHATEDILMAQGWSRQKAGRLKTPMETTGIEPATS